MTRAASRRLVVMKTAWHFLPADRCVPRLGTLIEVGMVEKHKGDLSPCNSGLHFSPRLLDALQYAPGPILREVRLSGRIVMDTDKGVASVRETLWMDNVEPMLRAFARWCALSVVDKWAAPPIVLKYLREGAEVDRAAARAAARDAAWAAARDAARDAQNQRLVQMIGEFRGGRREWRFD